MTETEKHKKLKRLGRVILRDRGYLEKEIFEEHPVQIGNRAYIVDVCGISNKEKVAVECGTTDPEKLTNLKLVFDEIIHLPYGITTIDMELRKIIEENTKQTKILEKKIVKQEEQIEARNQKIQGLLKMVEEHSNIMLIAEVLKRHAAEHFPYYTKDDEKVKAIMDVLGMPYTYHHLG